MADIQRLIEETVKIKTTLKVSERVVVDLLYVESRHVLHIDGIKYPNDCDINLKHFNKALRALSVKHPEVKFDFTIYKKGGTIFFYGFYNGTETHFIESQKIY